MGTHFFSVFALGRGVFSVLRLGPEGFRGPVMDEIKKEDKQERESFVPTNRGPLIFQVQISHQF